MRRLQPAAHVCEVPRSLVPEGLGRFEGLLRRKIEFRHRFVDDPRQIRTLGKKKAIPADKDFLLTRRVIDEADFAAQDSAELVFFMLFFENSAW